MKIYSNFKPWRAAALLTVGLLTVSNSVSGADPVNALKVKEGFSVEKLYTVPKDQEGSWVALCVDDQGRLITSDQYGGLFRITVPSAGQDGDIKIESIKLDIGHAQGLLYAFDSLYVVVNDEAHQGRGLYRVTDTDQDDQFDKVELLKKFEESGGEHGPHAVILGPDKQSLYVVVGNQTALPEYDVSRVPEVWGEDLLLPRVYGRGFMRGVHAPRGWIAKTDPEGKHWTIIATGFRNEYDAGFNEHGELFTYDADMEWDLNTPWYRPTRICHVVSGAEFGWRNGSGKWPPYYPDSLPAVLNVGPGSPTGVVFGHGAKFPEKYQKAFFVCDWSYGKLYAAHLQPTGASYTGELEEFISGSPLALTDIVINPKDGAMYFAVGGRRTQSALYRVTYTGKESTAPFSAGNEGERARDRRELLESFHGKKDPRAVEVAWPYLKSDDRFLRYAARVAIEHQDVSQWREKALNERDAQAALSALIALARVGAKEDQGALLKRLDELDWGRLSEYQKLAMLRAYALAFIRMGEPDDSTRRAAISRLNPLYPAQSQPLNSELCELLVYLQAPSAAEKTISLLYGAPTQEEQIDYAVSLRLLKNGWTPELREKYFRWFLRAASYRGGASFGNFITEIREDAVASLSEEERVALKPVLEEQPETQSPLEVLGAALAGRSFVKEWTTADLAPKVEGGLRGRDFDKGRSMFGAAACVACHRFGDQGGAMGPDLTGIGGRFSAKDILESTIEPNKEISDQYGQVVITLNDGRRVTGRIVNLHGDRLSVNTNMFDPNEQAAVSHSKIESVAPSEISMMPEGLLNMLNEEEILDLLAYMISGGDPNHPMFKK